MVHFFMAFSYSQSTYRITIQIHLTDRFCVIDTDIIKDSSLIDTEQQLIFIDRGSKVGLDLHTLFRSHEDLVTIDVGTESYAFFLDLS